MEKDSWDILEKECISCQKCVFGTNRKNVVMGRGNINAPILFIGEAPGETEDEQGRAFVGKAGQLLSMALTAMGMEEEHYYLCNVIKCRPQNNRTPNMDEIETCLPYLLRQIKLVNPKVIVLMGNVAIMGILDKNASVSRQRGTWYDYEGIPTMVTYHPAALLRDDNKKIDMWVDIKKAWKKVKEEK